MNKLACILAALAVALASCSSVPKVVKVPTPVTCKVKLPVTPDFAFDNLPPGADIFTQVKTLLADRQQRIDYERQLEAAGRACS